MLALTKGHYRARFAQDTQDLLAAKYLRRRAFTGDDFAALEDDPFDAQCAHVLVFDQNSTELVCCFRLLHLQTGRDIERSYSEQYYGLSGLRDFTGPMIEIGRFCIDPLRADPDILRVAWGALTRFVDDNNIEMLFGCASFSGTDAQPYLDSFALLKQRHIAPVRWLPKIKAPEVFQFAAQMPRRPDLKLAQQQMPPLLRSYLLMGGWVSDHAVVDQKMNTLHVFTGVEVKAIPPARKRLLRAISD